MTTTMKGDTGINHQFAFSMKKSKAGLRVKEWKKKHQTGVNETERKRRERFSNCINKLKSVLEKDSKIELKSKETVIVAAIDLIVNLKEQISTLLKNGTDAQLCRELALVRKQNEDLQKEKKCYIEILKVNALPTVLDVDRMDWTRPKAKIEKWKYTEADNQASPNKAITTSATTVDNQADISKTFNDSPILQIHSNNKDTSHKDFFRQIILDDKVTNMGVSHTMKITDPRTTMANVKGVDGKCTRADNIQWNNQQLTTATTVKDQCRPQTTEANPSNSALPPISMMMGSGVNSSTSSSCNRVLTEPRPQRHNSERKEVDTSSDNLKSWLVSSSCADVNHNKNTQNNSNQSGSSKINLSFTIDGLMQNQPSSRVNSSSCQLFCDQKITSSSTITTKPSQQSHHQRTKTLWQPAINNFTTNNNNSASSSYQQQRTKLYNLNYNDESGSSFFPPQSALPSATASTYSFNSNLPHHFKSPIDGYTSHYHQPAHGDNLPTFKPPVASHWTQQSSFPTQSNPVWKCND